MSNENSRILTAEQEKDLLQPIKVHINGIQQEINKLRVDGTDKIIDLQNQIDEIKMDRILSKKDKEKKIAAIQSEMKKANLVEAKNKKPIADRIAKAEGYLKVHFEKDYYTPVKISCQKEKELAEKKYRKRVAEIRNDHVKTVGSLSAKAKKPANNNTANNTSSQTVRKEIKEENYVYKNKLFDAKMEYQNELQHIKDRRHAAFAEKYHMIDLLRMSKFTISEMLDQKWENYTYTFNRRTFLLQNGLYIAIMLIFIALCIITQIVKHTQLLTFNNVLKIFEQASPRMYLALGVAGLILLTGTDLSIGRMVGMGMTAATIIMHKGINTGGVFGHIFDFTSYPIGARIILALIVCIILCTFFTAIAGFFTAKFKMHPFISTMANMLVIFGLLT